MKVAVDAAGEIVLMNAKLYGGKKQTSNGGDVNAMVYIGQQRIQSGA